ncbi:helix-turn-helix domain-containing protein [Mycolicibacterium fortuitum]|uniref:helix-turn-helix domain-containing protein n=1 Tax=Mycolicibacterium fortuitum TaxID=1766 RepID=UPI0034CE655B
MTVTPNPALPPVLTIEDLAEGWRVHPDSIRALIKSGELKAHRVGKLYRIVESDALAYFNGQAVSA